MTRIQTNGLQVAPVLHDFIEREALAYTGVSADAFWKGLAGLVKEFAPRDRERERADGRATPVALRQPGRLDDRGHRLSSLPRRRGAGANASSPEGEGGRAPGSARD